MAKHKNLLVYTLPFLFILMGCAYALMSRYDPETHKNMAYLKPVLDDLYPMYSSKVIMLEPLNEVHTRFKFIMAYEKSKGAANSDTVKQIEIVHNMFERHFKERLKGPVWTRKHMENKLSTIQEAIDMVIKSEISKNK